MKNIYSILLTLLISLFAQQAIAQDDGGKEPRNKIYEKKEKEREKERKKAEKEIKKRHMSIQTKETRKRMKQSKKQAKRAKKNRSPEPFWKKWFIKH